MFTDAAKVEKDVATKAAAAEAGAAKAEKALASKAAAAEVISKNAAEKDAAAASKAAAGKEAKASAADKVGLGAFLRHRLYSWLVYGSNVYGNTMTKRRSIRELQNVARHGELDTCGPARRSLHPRLPR